MLRWSSLLGNAGRSRGRTWAGGCGCAGSGCAIGIVLAASVTAALGALIPSAPAACASSSCAGADGSWLAPMSCADAIASQGYGNTRWERPHTGIDLVCPPGTPVRATHAGVFRQRSGGRVRCAFPVGRTGGLGMFGELDIGNIQILFGHLEAFALQDGVTVPPGEVIGFEGTSGCSSGFHLHYQVEVAGRVADPCPFLPAGYPSPHTGGDTRCWGAAPP